MKRIVSLLLCVLFCVTAVACDNTDSSDKQTDNTSVSSESVETTTETGEATATAEVISEESQKSFNLLLDNVKTVYAGSAGCSLRAVKNAVEFMKWAGENDFTYDDIESLLNEYISSFDEMELDEYKQDLSLVQSLITDLCKDFEGSSELIDSAGLTQEDVNFTLNTDKAMIIAEVFLNIE